MRFPLQDPHLAKLRDELTPVTVALANGGKLHGRIESFDQFVIIVMGDEQQVVYKSAISDIQVGRPNAIKKPHPPSANTLTARREFNPVADTGEDLQVPTRHKEPVVIVRKKLRTIMPPAD